MCKYTCMNSNRAYIHGYCSCVNDFFILFFSLVKLLLFPNIYNNPTRQNKKKEEENNHPTTKPNATTKHQNLAKRINRKLTQNQWKSNQKIQLKIKTNPPVNPTQKQSKPTGKPSPKSSWTHHKIIKIVLNLDPNSSNPYTNS